MSSLISDTPAVSIACFLIIGLFMTTIPLSMAAAPDSEIVSVTLTIPDFNVTKEIKDDRLAIEDFGTIFEPGKPRIPSRIFAIAIPPGSIVRQVDVTSRESELLPGRYSLLPLPLPRVMSDQAVPDEAGKGIYRDNYENVYGSDNIYPDRVGEYVRMAYYRKYKLVDVRINPFSYRPHSGELTFHSRIDIVIEYSVPRRISAEAFITDDIAKTEAVAREIIYNYDEAQLWYGSESIGSRAESHPLVIITTSALSDAVTPLLSWETQKGNNPIVVTIEWIASNYMGVDLAQKMRVFLREKYPSGQWGIQNVLFVGHHTDVPMRLAWQRLASGYGRTLTDLYFAELSLPDSQSWDSDQDGLYCDDTDTIDFYSEINVGRIPWSNFDTVQSICQKSVTYEQTIDPSFKKSILLLGAYFWEETDNAVLMEAKSNQPWMATWNIVKMYEKNVDYTSSYACDYPLTRQNVQAQWSNGKFAFVNWAGHGSPTSTHIYGIGYPAFIASSDCSILDDSFPAIIFGTACSNSDTDYLNIGQAMLARGAVGFVGANKVAYACAGWSQPDDGSSQTLDYYFTSDVTSGVYTQGEAHQRSLRHMYTHGLWWYPRYEMCEWSLWGNPCLGMTTPNFPETPAMSPLGAVLLVLLVSLLLFVISSHHQKVVFTAKQMLQKRSR